MLCYPTTQRPAPPVLPVRQRRVTDDFEHHGTSIRRLNAVIINAMQLRPGVGQSPPGRWTLFPANAITAFLW